MGGLWALSDYFFSAPEPSRSPTGALRDPLGRPFLPPKMPKSPRKAEKSSRGSLFDVILGHFVHRPGLILIVCLSILLIHLLCFFRLVEISYPCCLILPSMNITKRPRKTLLEPPWGTYARTQCTLCPVANMSRMYSARHAQFCDASTCNLHFGARRLSRSDWDPSPTLQGVAAC